MPTSTLWRRPSGTSEIRYRSPPRPTRDAIERLSPERFLERFLEPHTSGIPNNWASYQNNYHTPQGLGLSFDQQYNAEASFPTSQQLWVDQNEEARIQHIRETSAGGYNGGLNGYSNNDNYRVHSGKDSSRHHAKSRAHARSGSNIDTLATVALATSPTFTNGSPSTPQSSWHANSYSNGYDYHSEERPSKRARSEKLPSPEWTRRESRPATSYISTQPTQVSMDEAELLVNFAQNFNRPALRIAPPSHYAPRSPSYTRLSASTTSSEGPPMPIEEIASLPASPQGMFQSINQQEQVFIGNGSMTSPDVHRGSLWDIPEAEDMKPMEQREQNDVPTSYLLSDVVSQEEKPSRSKEETNQISQPETGSAEADTLVAENPAVKKPRRVKPTLESTSCAACNLLQTIESSDDKESSTLWISCNGCKRWYHASCAGFKDKREAQDVDKYICAHCEPIHGSTTYVRKSSRARTAIDYAGLNEGIVKSSTETSEHHYIQPIKDGKITFQPDEFARIRPELVTLEYFEKTGGMKRPMVIPACWNSRLEKRDSESAETATDASKDISELIDTRTDLVQSDDDGLEKEEVIDCDQDLLDMVMPRNLTVRKVSELYGPGERLDVIDVKSQSQGDKKWNMQKWADYYESTDEKVIRNVISLEVSQSKLGRLIRRPRIVRDLDLQDSVWPVELQAAGDYPKVQFYCLMSVADCYTDFHIDFGGSSVYYHILKGKKTFFFIPPEDKNLKAYENWCNSDTQDTTFLGEVTGECSRVDLSEGDTMLIPAGWIHAVWTPEDSLVIGGNFLTRQNYEMQIKVATIERETKVAQKFRYPHFQKIMWYTALKYLDEDPVPQEVLDDFNYDPDFVFRRANPLWHEFGDLANDKEPGDPYFNARFYSRKEIEGLPALRDFLYRTAKIACGIHVPGVSEGATRSVQRSIPKGVKEPLDTCKLFAIWCAWKISSVVAPEWTRPDAVSLAKLAEQQEKLKLPEVLRTPPERVSSRVASQIESARASQEAKTVAIKRSGSSASYESDEVKKSRTTTKASGLGPKRVACDACRKRRIRCRHKDDGDAPAAVSPDVPRSRTFSNLNLDVIQPMLSQSDTNINAPSQSDSSYPVIDANSFGGIRRAQEALVNLNLPEQDMAEDISAPVVVSSGKKGRSKACDECRKSKVNHQTISLANVVF
jgi:F-box and leucine-rich repeat protein 10/11